MALLGESDITQLGERVTTQLGERVKALLNDRSPRKTPSTEADELVMLKVTVNSNDNALLIKECDIKALSQIQIGIIKSVKKHAGKSASARVSFHKGSVIILITMTATIYISGVMCKHISSDIEALLRKILKRLSRVDVDVQMKRIKDATSILLDLLSIIAKLIPWLGGGGFSPMPPDDDPNGWSPI